VADGRRPGRPRHDLCHCRRHRHHVRCMRAFHRLASSA
jgi:hypothetical protein